jgi:hypothetical protein
LREQHVAPELHPSPVFLHARYAHFPPRHSREQHSDAPVQGSPVFLQAARHVPEQLLEQHCVLVVQLAPV